jgi:hypothetical protein
VDAEHILERVAGQLFGRTVYLDRTVFKIDHFVKLV